MEDKKRDIGKIKRKIERERELNGKKEKIEEKVEPEAGLLWCWLRVCVCVWKLRLVEEEKSESLLDLK